MSDDVSVKRCGTCRAHNPELRWFRFRHGLLGEMTERTNVMPPDASGWFRCPDAFHDEPEPNRAHDDQEDLEVLLNTSTRIGDEPQPEENQMSAQQFSDKDATILRLREQLEELRSVVAPKSQPEAWRGWSEEDVTRMCRRLFPFVPETQTHQSLGLYRDTARRALDLGARVPETKPEPPPALSDRDRFVERWWHLFYGKNKKTGCDSAEAMFDSMTREGWTVAPPKEGA